MSEENREGSCVGLIASFLFPIVGVVLFFVEKDKIDEPGAYLQAAGAGFAAGLAAIFLL